MEALETRVPSPVVEDVQIGRNGLERTATVKTEKGAFNKPVQGLHNLEIESTTPQANHEGKVPVFGGEKLKSDTVQIRNVRVPNSKPKVDLPNGGQLNVGRMGTFSGRIINRPMTTRRVTQP